MSTNVAGYIAGFFVAGVAVFAVLAGEEMGWGAGMTFLVVGIAAVVAIVPFMIWMGRRKKSRARAFAAAASSMGLVSVPTAGGSLLGYPVRLFAFGLGPEISNLYMRQGEDPVWVFDFTCYREGYNTQTNSTTRHDYEFTCGAVRVPGAAPSIVIGREGFFSRFARSIGIDDVETGDGAFDREFKVKASDPAAAQEVLHPQMRAWLVTLDERWSFELTSGLAVAYADRLPVGDLPLLEQLVVGFRGAIPAGLLGGPASQ